MVRRIATLLGLIGLAVLLCLVAALTSSCTHMRPVTPHELRHAYAGQGVQIEVVRAEVAAVKKDLVEFKTETRGNFAVSNENFQVLAVGVEQTKNRAEAAKNLSETIVKKLGPIGRDAAVASKEATAGRKAIEKVAADAKVAHTAIDQKVDRRADEVVGAVGNVDRKVDVTKTAAETAASRAGAARDAAIDAKAEAELAKVEAKIAGVKADAAGAKAEAAGAKAEAAGSRAEAAVATSKADTIIEVGKVRKELSDHDVEEKSALDAVKKHLGIP